MVKAQIFGRRSPTRTQPMASRASEPAIPQATTAPATPVPGDAYAPGVDDELREWKQSRRKNFQIPWRPVWLVASPCFGLASLVLPDSVNDDVQWLLYALMAASFYAGITRSRRAGT